MQICNRQQSHGAAVSIPWLRSPHSVRLLRNLSSIGPSFTLYKNCSTASLDETRSPQRRRFLRPRRLIFFSPHFLARTRPLVEWTVILVSLQAFSNGRSRHIQAGNSGEEGGWAAGAASAKRWLKRVPSLPHWRSWWDWGGGCGRWLQKPRSNSNGFEFTLPYPKTGRTPYPTRA